MDGVILHDGDCLHLLNARFWLQVVIQQRPVGIQATDAMDGAGARERRAIIRTKALEYTTITRRMWIATPTKSFQPSQLPSRSCR